ncbi:DUF3310 domain-containing protein [Enterococcus hirae]|nr:DUF3310 domain-containing protein [Enterococcus hirae]
MTNAIEPDYYQKGTIDVIEAFRLTATKEQFRGGMKLNVMKYIMRYENKNGIEDLEKAREYIDRLIKAEERYEAEEKVECPGLTLKDALANADKLMKTVNEIMKREPNKGIDKTKVFKDPVFQEDTIRCENTGELVLITVDEENCGHGESQTRLTAYDAIEFANKLIEIANEIVDERISGGPA